jgi:hypothetical protein
MIVHKNKLERYILNDMFQPSLIIEVALSLHIE